MSLPTVLEKIVQRKHQEVAQRQQLVSLSELRAQIREQSPVRGFAAALQAQAAANHRRRRR